MIIECFMCNKAIQDGETRTHITPKVRRVYRRVNGSEDLYTRTTRLKKNKCKQRAFGRSVCTQFWDGKTDEVDVKVALRTN